MAVKPKKKIEKESFSLDSLKESMGVDKVVVKDKELMWIPLSDAFHDALKIPGIPIGYMSSFRGFSNTGKSTAIYEGVVGCQKLGILPIIFDTEGNWNWEHARNIGVEFEDVVDETTGEIINYKGDFVFLQSGDLLKLYANYDYNASKMGTKPLRTEPVIEDVAMFMETIYEKQQNGEIPRDICFFWDSVGSLNCFKGATSKSNNNQWTAGAMAQAFKSLLNFKIPQSRRQDSPYTITFAVVQQIWLDNENKVVKHKGGEAFFYPPRLIVHYGGILTHSTTKLKAVLGGKEFEFGVETKIRCEKNQVNGVVQTGKICSTPHGYCSPDKLDEYKKEHRDFFKKHLETEYDDFVIEKEQIGFSSDDLKG